MKEIATLQFKDHASGGSCIIVVRSDDQRVALCLSQENGSDTEIIIDKEGGQKILAALELALA